MYAESFLLNSSNLFIANIALEYGRCQILVFTTSYKKWDPSQLREHLFRYKKFENSNLLEESYFSSPDIEIEMKI